MITILLCLAILASGLIYMAIIAWMVYWPIGLITTLIFGMAFGCLWETRFDGPL